MILLNVLKYFITTISISTCVVIIGCNSAPKREVIEQTSKPAKNWEQQFGEKLLMLGHRNWILVVDKAFPEQSSPGMEYIYANEKLLPVLKQVLNKIHQSTHVKPIIYQDKELNYITEDQAKGVKQLVQGSKLIFDLQPVKTMLHDSVFKKLDAGSQLFKVLVIKTNETIPYSSVFLQLDCAYWNSDKEKQLRINMK